MNKAPGRSFPAGRSGVSVPDPGTYDAVLHAYLSPISPSRSPGGLSGVNTALATPDLQRGISTAAHSFHGFHQAAYPADGMMTPVTFSPFTPVPLANQQGYFDLAPSWQGGDFAAYTEAQAGIANPSTDSHCAPMDTSAIGASLLPSFPSAYQASDPVSPTSIPDRSDDALDEEENQQEWPRLHTGDVDLPSPTAPFTPLRLEAARSSMSVTESKGADTGMTYNTDRALRGRLTIGTGRFK